MGSTHDINQFFLEPEPFEETGPSISERLAPILPWAYLLAWTLGIGILTLSAMYLVLGDPGSRRASLECLGAGLFIVVCAAWIRAYQTAGELERGSRRQQTILSLREYAEEILESLPCGVLMLSPKLNVLYANRAFLGASHLRREEVLGRKLERVIPDRGLLSSIREVLEGRERRGPLQTELPVQGEEEKRPVAVTLASITHGEDGEVRPLLLIEDLVRARQRHLVAEVA